MQARTELQLPSWCRYYLTDHGHLARIEINEIYYNHRQIKSVWSDPAEGIIATTQGEPDVLRHVLGIAYDPEPSEKLQALLPGLKYHAIYEQLHTHCWHDTGASRLILPRQCLEVCCHCAERHIVCVEPPRLQEHGTFLP